MKVEASCETLYNKENDLNDTRIINELYAGRFDALITDHRKLLTKALLLGVADRAFTIDSFLEKVTAENPELANYKVLSVTFCPASQVTLVQHFPDGSQYFL